jgi:poly(beta-D-mannuronate) C5 epimerase
MQAHHLFRLSLLSALMTSAHAVTVPAVPGSTTLERGGYRMTPIDKAPQRREWEKEAHAPLAGCKTVPPAPAAQGGTVSVETLVKDRYFNKFFQGGGRLERLVVQQKGVPKAIVIHSGVWRLSQLQARLAAEEGALLRQDKAYLLRLPLLLREGAGLVVESGESLRLSRDRGAFLINLGRLHVQNARLEAWDEGAKAVAQSVPGSGSESGTAVPAAPAAGDGFQPFLLGWSGSVTVIHDAQVSGLGFAENLAHGLEFAVGPIGLAGVELPPPPRVHVIGSSLEGLYSGVRGSGIPEMRICQNHFLQSRQNAVHLEAGSSGVVAENRITQTQGPYALYFNKSARNVWVIGNDISENNRSGLSINDSTDIVIAGNTIRQNFDAVFLQGSDHVLMAGNRIMDNQRHGVSMRSVGQVRFQDEHIGPNRGVGIMALRGGEKVASTPVVSAGGKAPPRKVGMRRIELLGVALEGNHSSTMVVEPPYTVVLDQADVIYPDVRRRPVFRGVLNAFEKDILYLMPRQKTLQLAPMAQATAGE